MLVVVSWLQVEMKIIRRNFESSVFFVAYEKGLAEPAPLRLIPLRDDQSHVFESSILPKQ